MSAESLQAVRDICASITRKVDREYIARCSKTGEFPAKLWQAWVETGLIGLGLPEEYGGTGGSTEDMILALDLQYQAGMMCTAIITNYMSRAPLLRYGTEAQKQRYLPPTATGAEYFSFGITEPDSGTNTFKIKTNARRRPDGSYVINGQKTYQTGFKEAAHVLLVARTSPHEPENRTSGISLFIVDTRSAGITANEMDIVGILPEKQYTVFYDSVVVPADNILAEEGKGLEALFESLNTERLLCSALNVAQADFVLNRAVQYAKTRAPFDKPIGAYQAIQHPMAHAKMLIEASRTMLYVAAQKHDNGEKISLESNMLKVLSSEAFKEAATIAMTTFGGSSVVESQDILPFFILSQLNTVAPINNNSVLSFIAEKALGLPKSY
jgi:alkylation response protein AidB-like acyl-CoA dehydrogenase